jgi:hypothetical protein
MTTDTRATTEENRSEEDTRLIPATLQKFLKAGGKKKKKQTKASRPPRNSKKAQKEMPK